MDEIRKRIYERVFDFVVLENQPRHLVFMSFPGSGKTTTVMKAVDEGGLRWIYAAPTHKVIEENIKYSGHRFYEFVHMKSKGKVCLSERARTLFEKGYDASFMCKNCGFFNVCEYIETQKKVRVELPNIGIVHSHLATWLPSFLNTKIDGDIRFKDEYDVLIIDENPVQYMFNATFLSYREMAAIRRFMLRINGYDEALYKIIGYLQMTPIDSNLIEEEAENILTGTKRKRFMENYSKYLLDEYENENIAYIPSNKIKFIYNFIEYEASRRNIENAVKKTAKGVRLYYFVNDILSGLGMRVIGLDGTASRELWSRILETDDFDLIKARYYHSNIFQLNNAKLPITTWKRLDTEYLGQYLDIIKEIARRRPESKVLVIATKWIIENVLTDYFTDTPNITFAHYYALRSRNEFYKECDTVVLACEPNPDPTTFRMAIKVSGWPKELWKSIYTYDEMIQALGRLRANITETPDGKKRYKPLGIILPSTGVGNGGSISNLVKEALVVDKKVLLDYIRGLSYTKDLNLMMEALKCLPKSATEFSNEKGISYYKSLKLMKRLEYMGYAKYEGSLRKFVRTGKAPPVIDEAAME